MSYVGTSVRELCWHVGARTIGLHCGKTSLVDETHHTCKQWDKQPFCSLRCLYEDELNND